MKIGTDGVLLGAWTSVKNNPQSILDLGAGTGIIALQMAQRSLAESIDAIEIDSDAFEQCVENFENSPWGDRLFCYHAALDEFTEEIDDTYDLIVSNPPFHSEDYKTPNSQRDTARFTDALPFDLLVDNVSSLLSEKGIFSVIIPKNAEAPFIDLALNVGLYPQRICHVYGAAKTKAKRSLIEFSFLEIKPEESTITIEIERHHYTNAYKNLVQDFYLKM
jgi:tRNA1Val (adenine37-N6)-methyltransferase